MVQSFCKNSSRLVHNNSAKLIYKNSLTSIVCCRVSLRLMFELNCHDKLVT